MFSHAAAALYLTAPWLTIGGTVQNKTIVVFAGQPGSSSRIYPQLFRRLMSLHRNRRRPKYDFYFGSCNTNGDFDTTEFEDEITVQKLCSTFRQFAATSATHWIIKYGELQYFTHLFEEAHQACQGFPQVLFVHYIRDVRSMTTFHTTCEYFHSYSEDEKEYAVSDIMATLDACIGSMASANHSNRMALRNALHHPDACSEKIDPSSFKYLIQREGESQVVRNTSNLCEVAPENGLFKAANALKTAWHWNRTQYDVRNYWSTNHPSRYHPIRVEDISPPLAVDAIATRVQTLFQFVGLAVSDQDMLHIVRFLRKRRPALRKKSLGRKILTAVCNITLSLFGYAV